MLAAEVAKLYGVDSEVPIPEVAPELVPDAVRRAAQQDSGLKMAGPHCTRFFDAGTRYLVFVDVTCPPDVTKDRGPVVDDGQLLVAYSAAGDRIGEMVGPYGMFFEELVPFHRDQKGNAFR